MRRRIRVTQTPSYAVREKVEAMAAVVGTGATGAHTTKGEGHDSRVHKRVVDGHAA